jgi:hypothetical protein
MPSVVAARAAEVFVALSIGLVSLGACSVDPTGTPPSLVPHCVDLEGNGTCLADYPGRPYCNRCVPASQNQGCVQQLPPLTCSPDGVTTLVTTTDDTGPDSTSTAGTTESSTSGPAPDTSSAPDSSSTGEPYVCRERGELDPGCEAIDPAASYCLEGACLGCVDAGGDEFCASLDATRPACIAETGLCEGCDAAGDGFCGGATPVCRNDGACDACQSHDECGTACHLAPTDPRVGECFPADQVLWVDDSAQCPGLGSEASPFCDLGDTVASVPLGESWTVFVASGTYPDQLSPVSSTIALRGDGIVQLTGDPGIDGATVLATGDTIYFENVRVRANTNSHGAVCVGGLLWFDDSQIRNNIGHAIYLTGPCDVTLRRTRVLRNVGGGIRQFGGTLRLDNVTIAENGDPIAGPALNIQLATVEAVYSTIVGNEAAGADSIQCTDAAGSIRNSIVSGATVPSIELDCFVLEYITDAIDADNFVEDGSVLVGAYDEDWFTNPAEGDMQLADPELTVFGGIALYLDGDPPLDADDTPRPMGGALGYVGVDEP